MRYETKIDTVSIQIDLLNEEKRNMIQKDILTLFNNYNFYTKYNKYKINTHSNFYIREYQVYYNKVVVASMKSGSYSYIDTTSDVNTTYYITLEFAGLKRYNEKLDKMPNEALINICAFLNTRYITFKITGLDIALDLFTDFYKVLALCTKKSPTTTYYEANEAQTYSPTAYIEKILQSKRDRAIQRAYLYDKTYKENLGYKVTRFEVKLQSLFFSRNRSNIISAIIKALNKYHVMYIPRVQEKQYLMNEYDIHPILRQRDIKRIGFDDYRCYHDITVIVEFINYLFSVQEK